MLADLVIVSHNSKADLERFLPSLREHTKDYNLIIIDSGSDKVTTNWLEMCGESVIFSSNVGYGRACNKGANMLQADIIVFLNADLLASPNWLTDLLEPFKDEKVAVTGARLFNEAGQEYPTPKEGHVIGCCYAIRRKVFEQLGGFDENFFLFFEETDLSVRVVEAGYRIVRSEAKLTHFHPHFPPFSPELQKHWDKSKAYFKSKRERGLPDPSVALVMIVKNEELGLEQAILSCKDFVSEIIIAVDKKSTDGTLEIAKKYATTVKLFDFDDDFSVARNFAAEGVKSDWILFLDGHEAVARCDGLKTALQGPQNGLLCTVELENGSTFRNVRLYRKGAQFRGKVHEKLDTDKLAFFGGILIKHNRLGAQSPAGRIERDRQRDDQVPRVMTKEWQDDHKDIRAAFHLALHWQVKEKYHVALMWWGRYLRHSNHKAERWYVFFQVAICHLALRHYYRALWYAAKAENETPGRWEIEKLLGLIQYHRKKYSQAIDCLVASFKVNTCEVAYEPWARDEAGSWNLIGECFFNLGNYEKAALSFDRAVELCKDEMFKGILKKRATLMADIAKARAK